MPKRITAHPDSALSLPQRGGDGRCRDGRRPYQNSGIRGDRDRHRRRGVELDILHDAGRGAAQARGATLRNAPGRRGLFDHTYPVAWGSQKKKPDAFLTGEILVAKITTPAWTPLFALASGIVTDVGEPLSHSSIVAREYQLPAVLGTGVATERIASGRPITVDGDGGVVKIGSAQP